MKRINKIILQSSEVNSTTRNEVIPFHHTHKNIWHLKFELTEKSVNKKKKSQAQIPSDSRMSLHGVCCLLMAALFALSTSFQFDDPDWYFWIPLYSSACVVNLVKWADPKSSRIGKVGKFGFWLGLFLLIKVCIEDLIGGPPGFWSFDMREKVVMEKFGSGLVVCSMFLALEKSSSSRNHPTQLTKYGMPILVGIAYGLSFIFFGFQYDGMRY